MSKLSSDILKELCDIWGPEQVSTGESVLNLHAEDESIHPPHQPDVVVYARDAQGVSTLLKLANRERIPVTPWGMGTSMEGNPIPTHGGIVLDMVQMDQVIEVWPDDMQVRVQPGITYPELNKKLTKHGLFFPPDPGAAASIGGMIANNAGGIQALKYGVTRDCVQQLEVVLPNGEIIQTGTRANKTSSGYALTHLFVGSEGTLGVVTEATLKLSGIPKEVMAAVATFHSADDACKAAIQIMQSGTDVAALELLDGDMIPAINRYNNMNLAPHPTLFMVFHGNTKIALEEEASFIKDISDWNNAIAFDAGVGRQEIDRLWEARHHAQYAIKEEAKGQQTMVVDVAVPVSKLAELVEVSKDILHKHELKGYVYGHAGQGNLHVRIFRDEDDSKQWDAAEAANEAIVNYGLSVGGTATGEHGVGIGKKKFMAQEHGASLDVMRQLKQTLDPIGIMNPGKKL